MAINCYILLDLLMLCCYCAIPFWTLQHLSFLKTKPYFTFTLLVLLAAQHTPLSSVGWGYIQYIGLRLTGPPQAKVMTEQLKGLNCCCSRTSTEGPHQPTCITITVLEPLTRSQEGDCTVLNCTELTVGSYNAEQIFSTCRARKKLATDSPSKKTNQCKQQG